MRLPDAVSATEAFRRYTQEWMDAIRSRDRAALESFLAPEFRLTSARTDQWIDRERWLELALSEVEMVSFSVDEMETALIDDTAIVWSRISQQAKVAGEDWSDRFMLTDVWVRREDRWQVVARHSSQPPSGDFAAVFSR